MRKTTIYLVGVALFFGSACTNKSSIDSSKKPNVIILFSDQHNKKVLGF